MRKYLVLTAVVLLAACRAIDLEGSAAAARAQMREAGVLLVDDALE